MNYSTLGQLRSILELAGNTTPTEFDTELARLQAEVHQLMVARMEQCKPGESVDPLLILNEEVASGAMTFDTVMATGKRRLLLVLKDASGAYGSAPTVTIIATLDGMEITEVVSIDQGDGFYLTTTAFDQVTLADVTKVVADADVITSGAKLVIFEGVGELSDIEARWAAGMFQMESADRYDKESEPPEMHPWIADASANFEAFLDRFCLSKTPGRRRTHVLGRSHP